MHTIEIPDRNKTIYLPSCWDECTADQSDYILQRAFDMVFGRIDRGTFLVMVFVYLTGLTATARHQVNRRLLPDLAEEADTNIFRLAEQLCAWPFQNHGDEDEQKLELTIDTVTNMLPIINAGGNILYGPADLLSDLTFAEFRAANREMDEHIRAVKELEDPEAAMAALNRFVAVLYRPAENGTERRTSFNGEHINKYATLVRVAPNWQKQTILLWYTYCIKYIQTEDIVIDGHTINLSVLFPKSAAGTGTKKSGIGWAGLLYDIAKEGVFGDAEKTDKAGLFDILIYLYKQYHENKELERKLNKSRKK